MILLTETSNSIFKMQTFCDNWRLFSFFPVWCKSIRWNCLAHNYLSWIIQFKI